ncbi:hypothetical protein KIN20_028920 [Parelaphostrongylus tenuis]|uniref:Uncharacterized protein n=1 Tax=Parelaphostrongylus tenuis TaxID=148309 RepID=A0AAD5WFG1_PARTN|nr:hypothetical protein KIN20_028920 [Parelaphostrongylus tenuis]
MTVPRQVDDFSLYSTDSQEGVECNGFACSYYLSQSEDATVLREDCSEKRLDKALAEIKALK